MAVNILPTFLCVKLQHTYTHLYVQQLVFVYTGYGVWQLDGAGGVITLNFLYEMY